MANTVRLRLSQATHAAITELAKAERTTLSAKLTTLITDCVNGTTQLQPAERASKETSFVCDDNIISEFRVYASSAGHTLDSALRAVVVANLKNRSEEYR